MAIRAVLWGMPLMAGSFATTVVYAATTYPVNITQLPLDEALKQLAIQTGTTISYDSKALSNLQAKALKVIMQSIKRWLHYYNLMLCLQ